MATKFPQFAAPAPCVSCATVARAPLSESPVTLQGSTDGGALSALKWVAAGAAAYFAFRVTRQLIASVD